MRIIHCPRNPQRRVIPLESLPSFRDLDRRSHSVELPAVGARVPLVNDNHQIRCGHILHELQLAIFTPRITERFSRFVC